MKKMSPKNNKKKISTPPKNQQKISSFFTKLQLKKPISDPNSVSESRTKRTEQRNKSERNENSRSNVKTPYIIDTITLSDSDSSSSNDVIKYRKEEEIQDNTSKKHFNALDEECKTNDACSNDNNCNASPSLLKLSSSDRHNSKTNDISKTKNTKRKRNASDIECEDVYIVPESPKVSKKNLTKRKVSNSLSKKNACVETITISEVCCSPEKESENLQNIDTSETLFPIIDKVSTGPNNETNDEIIESVNNSAKSKSQEHFSPIKCVPILKLKLSPSKAEIKNNAQKITNSVNISDTYFNVDNIDLKNNKTVGCHSEIKQNTAEKCSEMKKAHKSECFDEMFADDWDEQMNDAEDEMYELNLETWQRCNVLSVRNDLRNCVIIKVKSLDSIEKTTCCLRSAWVHTKVSVGDTVSIKASPCNDETGAKFVIDTKNGLIIVSPDFLINTTSVVGSLFCRRRSILSDLYKSLDVSADFITIGSLVHELLQEVLGRKLYSQSQIEQVIHELMKSKQTIKMMYSSEMTTDVTRQKILEFLPHVYDFVNKYFNHKQLYGGKLSNRGKDDWCGTIESVHDIEENIWSPQLGIKGKIDVTVKVKQRIGHPKCMPLELKTGRASKSPEHVGQIILYLLMMKELGHDVESGLLLYLKNGSLHEITSNHNEQRDLIMLRNDLAYYLTRKPHVDNESKICNAELPEPINNRSACEKCPQLTVCSMYLSRDSKLSETHPLKIVSESAISHLTSEDIDYFLHWSNLVLIEENHQNYLKPVDHLWTKTPEERARLGKSLINMNIKGNVIVSQGSYRTTFAYSECPGVDDKQTTVWSSGILVGNYLVISTDKRPGVAAGFVTNITKYTMTVVVERDLKKLYPNTAFHLDTYDSKSYASLTLTGLSYLLNADERSQRLRNFIIKKHEPTFSPAISKKIAHVSVPIIKRLNKLQQRAVIRAVAAHDYMLIKGMPGAGKTATIVAIIELLMLLGNKVLVTSHTNSAVDNVLIRLQKQMTLSKQYTDGVILRLGSDGKIHPDIKSCSETHFLEKCESVEELEVVFNNAKVVGVTCLGSSHSLLSHQVFDVCLVDESTQVLQPTVLRPLLAANKFILIGDPDQLPPVVRNSQATELGLAVSLFERLNSSVSTVTLTNQYRMNRVINDLANSLTYKGELLCANDQVANATLEFPHNGLSSLFKNEPWLAKACSKDINDSVVFIDTMNTHERCMQYLKRIRSSGYKLSGSSDEKEETLCSNICEAAIIYKIVNALKKLGISKDAIGVIAPYNLQVQLLKEVLSRNLNKQDGLEVSTVDQYQGRDKKVIIYSGTNSTNMTSKADILEDHRRLTVAVTRAKHKLILIGDKSSLKKYTPFNKLITCLKDNQISTIDETNDDQWNGMLDEVENVLKGKT